MNIAILKLNVLKISQLGHVIFYCLPISKVYRLLGSQLPRLNGHFPLSTTLTLRLFNLLTGSNESEFAINLVNSLLKRARMATHSSKSYEQILHFLRFSIELLRRQKLIDENGCVAPLGGLVMHLYYHEPGNFAFYALLQSGVLRSICRNIKTKTNQTMDDMMIILSHLFGRIYISKNRLSFLNDIISRSPSRVILPALPDKVLDILKEHEENILETYALHAISFAQNHGHEIGPDEELPFTKRICRPHLNFSIENLGKFLNETIIQSDARSAFIALSGHGDNFQSVPELVKSVRKGLFLTEQAVPSMQSYQNSLPLNAYLVDFFCHGQKEALNIANHIRGADVWFLLKDFSLVLATSVTIFNNIIEAMKGQEDKISESSDYVNSDVDDIEDERAFEEMERPAQMNIADYNVYLTIASIRHKFDRQLQKIGS